jgi:hypothetical protein
MKHAFIVLGSFLLFSDVAGAQDTRDYRNMSEDDVMKTCTSRAIETQMSDAYGREVIVFLCHDRNAAEPMYNYLKYNGVTREDHQGRSYSLRSMVCWEWHDDPNLPESIACAVLRHPM